MADPSEGTPRNAPMCLTLLAGKHVAGPDTDQAELAIALVALPYSIGLSFFGRSAYQL